ncbi:Eco57I restriction-modification methylase domain-containing protein [Streptomyces rubradiris]|uniref:site-specific DNA-methyltransferase (adenine-specific) n=1 Tax=Streptomyces rubradiris TaxID=285531 RepID=A0ABQ3RLU8_STRRR|nr:Eco57I restriction-modification methylase domain-containing protein [Streptomyces rubradiris]GHH09475.1 RNA methyltransferase [Streptomyces rubradiris]GHI56836.1 RNA methyltransferase [Streptomyces rubradiris]
MPELLAAAALPEAKVSNATARPLGSRGSRDEVTDRPAGLTSSAAAVLAGLAAWWKSRASAAGLDGAWLDIEQALQARPPAAIMDGSVEPADLSTLGPEQVGAAYVEALSAATRARHGRHYTPRELAVHLWGMARDSLGLPPSNRMLTGLVLDPACGGGALLLPALREHLRAAFDVDPALTLAGLPNLLRGVDADEAAVWVANVVLAAEMLPTLARVPASVRKPLPALAHVGDGLDMPAGAVRVVVMNPPYGRVRLSPAERERYAHVLYGHANLYGLFMARAIDALDGEGVLAALVPTSFTSGRYFSKLRDHISQEAAMSAVAFVEDRSGVFTSVLQETCLATFERRKRRKTRISSLGSSETTIASVKTQRTEQPWVLPRRSDDAPIAAAASAMEESLGSLGWRASTGPLVWNRRSSDLYPSGGPNRSHVIWAADLDGGVLHRDPARDAMRFLALTAASDLKVMVLDSPAVLVQRTTAPEQSRRLVAAHLSQADLDARDGRVTVENHVNVLRCSAGADSVLTPDAMTRLLATKTMDKVVRCISGSVALSAYELESIPMPHREIVRKWNDLEGDALEAAVAAAYRPTGA